MAVWLDSPLIEIKKGKGTIERMIPAMMRMFLKYNIDMRKHPVLVYPTLHYQNGGLKINLDGSTRIDNLYVAGEAVGGIHGRNRLMGNSLLDIIVFGRNAGQSAAQRCKTVNISSLSLDHVDRYEKELKDPTLKPAVVKKTKRRLHDLEIRLEKQGAVNVEERIAQLQERARGVDRKIADFRASQEEHLALVNLPETIMKRERELAKQTQTADTRKELDELRKRRVEIQEKINAVRIDERIAIAQQEYDDAELYFQNLRTTGPK